MAKAREPKVFKSMDDLPLMLTPYDLMDFLGKGQRQTYELIHSEGFPYVQDGPKIERVRRPIHTALFLQRGKRQRYRQRLRKPWDW